MKILLFILLLFSVTSLYGQDLSTGPVIDSFGQVYSIDNPDLDANHDLTYRVIFDIYVAPESHNEINPQINTMARFLNMHVQAGVAREQVKVAGVFHGAATFQVADNSTYRAAFGVDNPNRPLLDELLKAGVDLIICGQSMYSKGLGKEQLAPGIQVALSAMTAIVNFHQRGYVLIKF